MATRYALYPIIASVLVGACVAASGPHPTQHPAQIVREAPEMRDRAEGAATDDRAKDADASAALSSSTVPHDVPDHEPEERPLVKTTAPSAFTRSIDRARIEARGAPRVDARIDAATLRAAAMIDNRAWTVEERRELLAFLRGGAAHGDRLAVFTEADARIVAQLQAGSGASVDGLLGDETMALLLAMGFRFSPRKVVPAQVKLDFFPGELEDIDAWNREIEEKVTKNHGGFRDVNEPEGEGTIYVYVGRTIVARYRGRGGPPSALEDGKHTALPTKPGVYVLGPGQPHVTSNWFYSQIPWGAEIRESEGGYQYRSAGQTKWSWATRHPAGKLKDPYPSGEFDGLPEVTRAGVKYLLWNKNDFGPIAWNLVPSDQYLHTTPQTEAQTADAGAVTSLGLSHGCVRVDPRERDEMVKRGYLGQNIRFVVRRWDEHLLPNEVRHEMIDGTLTTPSPSTKGVCASEAQKPAACSDESAP